MDDIVLAFEAITGGKPIAYYDDGKRILFVVDGKNVGKYIGKGGKNVKLLSTALKRDIYIAGYYEDPVQFIKSFYRELDISEIVKEGNKYIVKINDRQQRAMAIGKEGWRINLLNRALKELYNASAEIFQPKEENQQ
ncbi:NEQ180 [Nanoarchaeum equitans Kin4-M]|uniref:NEQ180 n=1 Tax=Nanoarchaeum equitans (strain Kin4-M) TaxID=228908 RepID=Q74MP0_NANEQ|nr:NEQ180 [Nanoarchaeum equitans Kin4-M]